MKISKAICKFFLALFILASPFICAVYMGTYRPYNQIEIGMSEAQIAEIVEEQFIVKEDYPFLCREQLWYGDCSKVISSKAEYYLQIKLGIDTYAIIGISNGKVVTKGLGDA